jgi:hypothetical protein
VYSTLLYHSKTPLQNIRFYNPNTKEGDVLFFINETKTDITKFLHSQPKGYFDNIVIPNIISNFLGKKLSAQKHYADMKKALPNYIYTRIPNSKYRGEKTSIFDLTDMMTDIINLSKTRSKKIVMDSFLELIEKISNDYPKELTKTIFIYGDNKLSAYEADFLQLINYYFKLNGNRVKTNFESIVYFMNKQYYPLTLQEIDQDGNKHLKLNLTMMSLVIANKEKNSKNEAEINVIDIESEQNTSLTKLDDLRNEINKLASDTSDNKTKKDGEYYDLAEHGIQFELIKSIPVLQYNDTTDDSIKDVDVSKVNKVLCESKLDGYYNLSWTKDDLVSLKRVKFELVILSNISSKYPASQHDVVPISFTYKTYKSSNEHDRTIPSAFIVGFYENSDENEKIGDPILYIPKN